MIPWKVSMLLFLQIATLSAVPVPAISALVQPAHELVSLQVHSLSKKVSKASIAKRVTDKTMRMFLRVSTRLERASFWTGRQMALWKSEKLCWDLVPTMG